ncbi:MAG: hypothetical protein ACYC2K_06100 [Gemmatimonadales bacterium]
MREADRAPLASIALIAAFADGFRSPEEMAELERIAVQIGGSDYDDIAHRVVSDGADLPGLVAQLSGPEARSAALELAAAVVHADGLATDSEQAFLRQLTVLLERDSSDAPEVRRAAEIAAAAAVPDGVAVAGTMTPAEMDRLILDNAMLTAALELLPQGLATLGIVPLQLRMVYRIGRDHGQALDADQAKDLVAAMGVVASGQVMEGVARKLLGGLTGGLLGRLAGGLMGAATGAALTFATTYALGHATRQYYAQGRSLSSGDLKQLFLRLRDEAKGIFPSLESKVRDRATKVDVDSVLRELRSS